MAGDRSCRESALALLARRSHTRRELTTKLRRKGFEAPEIAALLDDLALRGLLDDSKTASSLARSAAARGKGTGRIRAELAAKGVSRSDVDAALSELDPGDEAASLRLALAKKRRSLSSGLTPAARSKKLFDHLVRRGFSPGAVLEALREKGDPADDDP